MAQEISTRTLGRFGDPEVERSSLSIVGIQKKKKKILAALAERSTGLTTDTTNKKKQEIRRI